MTMIDIRPIRNGIRMINNKEAPTTTMIGTKIETTTIEITEDLVKRYVSDTYDRYITTSIFLYNPPLHIFPGSVHHHLALAFPIWPTLSRTVIDALV